MAETLEHIVPVVAPGDVIAVIPAYNEERFIGSVVINALQHADTVIVVDDGSTDRTALLAEMAGAEVIRLPENGGKGLALNRGFDRARELWPQVVVTLDADAQHDPAEIPHLVQPIVDGEADVVIGSRFLDKISSIPRWRQIGQHALTVMTNTASGVTTTDSQSGFRAFSRAALHKLRFQSKGLAMESEMQFLMQRASLRVSEVPISVQYLDGNKRNPIAHGLQVVDAILTLVARRRPLLFMGLPGILLMLAGFVVGLLVVEVINHQHIVPLGSAVLSALLVIVGLVLGIAGIILNTMEHFMSRLQQEFHVAISPATDNVSPWLPAGSNQAPITFRENVRS